MADDPTKVVALHGVGLVSGTLPDGRPCLHYGGVFRFKGPADNPDVAKAFVEGAMAGVEALRNRNSSSMSIFRKYRDATRLDDHLGSSTPFNEWRATIPALGLKRPCGFPETRRRHFRRAMG